MKICPNCGAQLDDNVKFCGDCGTVIGDTAPQGVPVGMQNNGAAPNQQAAPNYQQGVPNYQQAAPNYQQGAPNYQQAAPSAPKPNPLAPIIAKLKANPIILAIAGAALVIIIVLIIVIANVTKYQRIDAEELFKFDFDGLNNYGTVTGELNCYPSYFYEDASTLSELEELIDDYGLEDYYDLDDKEDAVSDYFAIDTETLLNAWSKADGKSEAASMRKALLKTNSKGNYKIKCTFDKEEELANGDKIKVTVEYDEDYLKEYNIKLTNTEFEIEVKDLEEGVEFDPFDEKYISVSFSGHDGSGEMDVDTSGALDCISYDYSYAYDLSEGDTVTITAYCYASLEKAGDKQYFEYDDKYYIVESDEMSKEYEVTGLTPLEEIDPFEGLTFTYSRATPFLEIDYVDQSGCSDLVQDYVYFEIEADEALDIGDTFTVKATISNSGTSNGYKLAGTPDSDGAVSKVYTIDETYPAYVTAENGVAAMEAFKTSVDDKIQDLRKDIKGSKYLSGVTLDATARSITSFELQSTYVSFNNKSDYDSYGWGEYVNRVYALYKIEVETNEEDNENDKNTFYAIIYSESVTFDGTDYSGNDLRTAFYATMDDFKEDIINAEGYTTTKCSESSDDSAAAATTAATTTTTAAAADDSEDESSTASTTTKQTEADDSEAETVVP